MLKVTQAVMRFCYSISFFLSFTTVFPVLFSQIDHYAQRDLKKGLQLFGTEGNVGLTNAWMIVQTDVRYEITEGGRWWWSGRSKTVTVDLSHRAQKFKRHFTVSHSQFVEAMML